MPGYSRNIPLPGKTADEIYSKISQGVDWVENNDAGKFGKFEFIRNDQAKTVSLKNALATADLVCKEDEIVLNAKLSLVAYAFRPKIDEGIDRWIKKTFPA